MEVMHAGLTRGGLRQYFWQRPQYAAKFHGPIVDLQGKLPAQLTAGACFALLCSPADDADDGAANVSAGQRAYAAAAKQQGSFAVVFQSLHEAIKVDSYTYPICYLPYTLSALYPLEPCSSDCCDSRMQARFLHCSTWCTLCSC